MAAGWKPPHNLTAEVARSTAEEIPGKVDRHGFRPLQPNPMVVGEERFFPEKKKEKSEARWYRGRRVLSSSSKLDERRFILTRSKNDRIPVTQSL
jgi:hypothetical protein